VYIDLVLKIIYCSNYVSVNFEMFLELNSSWLVMLVEKLIHLHVFQWKYINYERCWVQNIWSKHFYFSLHCYYSFISVFHKIKFLHWSLTIWNLTKITQTTYKVTAFWDIALCILVEIHIRQVLTASIDGGSKLLWNSVCFCETTWHNIPDGCCLHTCCHENLKSHNTHNLCPFLHNCKSGS
jgi:hypothetical protein